MSSSPIKTNAERMEKIVSLCKRRGFVFQSSEIYGGLNGCWDYGPLGVELKRNLKDFWWRRMTRERDDIVGLDGSILMNRKVWQASGHEATFSDPMVDCLLTKKRFRADQIEPQSGTVFHFTGAEAPETGWKIGKPFAVLLKKGDNVERARKTARQFYAQDASFLADAEKVAALELKDETTEPVENSRQFNPENGAQLTEPRAFNLMFKTYVGATEDENSIAYLRPETAQAIFVQFKNVLEVARKKLPFGIVQIGKAFRNEINPRNFIFRSREFEQMELEYFCRPEQGMDLLHYWLEERLKFYVDIGLPREKLKVLDVPADERAHYSKGTFDIEYEFPFGVQELEGVAYRTDYDLKQHQQYSGKPLEYFDDETKEKFIPHVVEPSAGVDRTVLALLCEAYDEETVTDEKGKSETRVVLRFHPRMAPIKCGVFPLLKNKPELVEKARQVAALLKPHMNVFYDETGAIGRRYRRQDEAGTPFGVTIDFETLGERGDDLKDTVTLRHRDSMKQERLPIAELPAYLLARIV
jgi:glycyl-tRNA synthetase